MEALLPVALSPTSALLLIFLSFFTSALTALAGIGGGLVMLGLMSYFIPVAALIPVHGVVQLGSNASRCLLQRKNINWSIAVLFIIGGGIGAMIGAALSIELPEKTLYALIGFFVLFIVWVKLPPLQTRNKFLIASGGLFTNFISMFAGATGPLVAVFLNHLFQTHKEMVATHAMIMTLQHGFKIIAFGILGFAFYPWLPFIIAMIFTGFLGTKIGTLIMLEVPEKLLKTIFKSVITIIAIDLIRRALVPL